MNKTSKIYLAGHNGMVGSAILRNLRSQGYSNFVFTPHKEYDLTNQQTVQAFFEKEKPEYVIIAAAKVGGILANDTFRGQFIYENLMIQNNLIHASHLNNVKKLLFLGSSCIYPKTCSQPMKEEYLLDSPLEKTNEPYAIAKIAGIKMCENYFNQYGSNFISVMPTNLYGPGDNFDLDGSHVIPALLRKIHTAKGENSSTVSIWGSGKPRREFLYVDEMAQACAHVFDNVEAEELYTTNISHLNVGSGVDLTIRELAEALSEIIGFEGELVFDTTKPDGTMVKLLDVSRLSDLGWKNKTDLATGLTKTYKWFIHNYSQIRK
jgi:GDP-L-fucose synthase